MILRLSSLATVFAFTLASVALSAPGLGATLTVQSARVVVEASETAWKHSNLDQAARYVSQDCVVRATMPKPDGTIMAITETCQQSLDESRKFSQSAISHGAVYSYDSTPPMVEVRGDIAIAHLHSKESLTKADKSLQVTQSDQVVTLQLRGGKVLITKVDIKTASMTVGGRSMF